MLELILFAVGVFVGIYASVVGGGALVLVPFFSLMGTPILTAVATMRLGATAQELVSALAFWKRKAIDWSSVLWVSLWTMLGSFYGARLVINLDKKILSYAVGLTMIVLLFLISRLGKPQNAANSFSIKRKSSLIVIGIISLFLGIYGGFYGAGFGTIMLFLFSFIGGSSLLSSAGNARVIGFFMSLSASGVFLQQKLINWQLFYPITAGMVVGSWFGVGLAAKFGSGWIKFLLSLIILASAIKLFLFPG